MIVVLKPFGFQVCRRYFGKEKSNTAKDIFNSLTFTSLESDNPTARDERNKRSVTNIWSTIRSKFKFQKISYVHRQSIKNIERKISWKSSVEDDGNTMEGFRFTRTTFYEPSGE